MTPPNPLVTGPVNTSTPFQGAFLLEDGEALVQAIRSGDWVAGGFAAFSAAMDTVAAVSDPLGSLIAAGLGWLMEHLEPLKGWLNDLTGDSGQVAGFAQTWTNVGGQLRASAADLASVLGDLDAADGAAVQAYLRFQKDVVDHLHGAASWADGMAAGMQMASTIVQVVHDLVRDALAQLVGSLISYAAELVFTLGLATPLVIEQASTRVASLVGKFSKKIPDLVDAIRRLAGLLEKLKALFKKFGDVADNALKGGGRHGAPGERGGVLGKGGPPEVPLTDAHKADIVATAKGSRPDPSTYLPSDYIDAHLAEFDSGATRFMTDANFTKYGIGQRDGTAFVMPKSEVDALMTSTGADPRLMEKALGLPDGFLDGDVVRVDVRDPAGNGLRMPSGNEAGANDEWIPGGLLPTGLREGVIDVGHLGPGGYDVNPMGSGGKP
ncbi:hypothetical protein [Microbacterium capsulatum]|uniref:WXG100 family type VII secretion target n=1 Tax=Microbacterium capsulatum TaxID=3041921 RepID=A0ABU0XJE1_9MICO|nr:hypothetical protein [Microbacterium sp. ASV81]MDQ4215259.1 hypothetical protein [Microbacterium sp. ASV81]